MMLNDAEELLALLLFDDLFKLCISDLAVAVRADDRGRQLVNQVEREPRSLPLVRGLAVRPQRHDLVFDGLDGLQVSFVLKQVIGLGRQIAGLKQLVFAHPSSPK